MHPYLANPARFVRVAKGLTPWLLWPGLLMAFGAAAYGLLLGPAEQYQGDSVRIIYLHVPAAWLAVGGWTGIALASFVQLVWRHPLSAVTGRAMAVPGAVFSAICLATGSLWGKPTWGTYWQWDGRMTSMLILLFLYFGYIALASAEKERGGEGRLTAIFGLAGAINIPIIRYSVEWWESLHQKASISIVQGRFAMDMSIGGPLLIAALGFTLLFAAIVLMRMRAELARNKVEARMRRMANVAGLPA
jgi:heme exporter protein C